MNPYKVCPRCQMTAALDATVCGSCGHIYTTNFAPPQPPIHQTTAFNPNSGQHMQGSPGFQPVVNIHNYNYRSDMIFPKGNESPVLCLFLSLLCCVPLGQMLNRQYLKAICWLVVGVIMAAFTGGFGGILYWVAGAIDAFCIANKLSQGRPVGQWESF